MPLLCLSHRSRKKIAKYKAAAMLAQRSEAAELQVVSEVRDDGKGKSSMASEPLLQGAGPVANGDAGELKAGDIVVKWKDGNVSNLYTDSAEEEEKLHGSEESEVESAAEPQEGAVMME